jgi:hypothetical protein
MYHLNKPYLNTSRIYSRHHNPGGNKEIIIITSQISFAAVICNPRDIKIQIGSKSLIAVNANKGANIITN